ncbi:hypothetical protein [Burkholderia sp. CCA53]|uniref:hypothetical protein n=1 Tax=Burkholderia sp. CCA53 TaxID=1776288 RepID=UPI00080BF6E0|nr:hypothetical protein [Burkholderia sp. CCA53]
MLRRITTAAVVRHVAAATAVLALSCALTACDADQRPPTLPKSVFNQKLTDEVRSKWTLPADVDWMLCWPEHRVLGGDRVACTVTLRGRAVSDMSTPVIRWEIPLRAPSPWDDPYRNDYLDPSFDVKLLDWTSFKMVLTNSPQGVVSVGLIVDESRVPFKDARMFVLDVTDAVSRAMFAELNRARAAAPDAIRDTWR